MRLARDGSQVQIEAIAIIHTFSGAYNCSYEYFIHYQSEDSCAP
jgi:hypothetical protein